MNTQLLGPIGRALMPPDWLAEPCMPRLSGRTPEISTTRERARDGLNRSRNRILRESGGRIGLPQIPKRPTGDDYDLAKAALNMARTLLANESKVRGNEYFASLFYQGVSKGSLA